MSTAVFAGSFDPPTLGHAWLIRRGASLFGKLIVAVGHNREKRYLFSPQERLAMLAEILCAEEEVELCLLPSEQYLVDFAKERGARYMLRGLRGEEDLRYEQILCNVNGDMASEIETVFLMPPRELGDVSSTMVKTLMGYQNWEVCVGRYVPPHVLEKLKEKVDGKTSAA